MEYGGSGEDASDLHKLHSTSAAMVLGMGVTLFTLSIVFSVPLCPLSLSILFPFPSLSSSLSLLKATHTFVWMVAQNQTSVQSSWNFSLPQILPTSSFCSQQEQVVWALIFRLPTLSSYLTQTGTHTRCIVHGCGGGGGGGGRRWVLSSVSNLLSYVHLSSIETR